ncbi:hypothetical protein C8Q78DRAFT_1072427 [Trametes maxima]|nr:hypothetical protein C8Q78DRAFT_1072427 [Trametes maxima]
MDEEFYEYRPPAPEVQHNRLVALRQLNSRGIPTILWGEDALCYVYSVATALFDQQIIIPDDLRAVNSYIPTTPAPDYAECYGPNKGSSPFPGSIRLCHLDIPESDPYRLDPIPAKGRFQSLLPPLHSSNADILIPKYHTFLEGLTHFIMNPPTGLLDVPVPHIIGKMKHNIFIGYLISWRVRYDPEVELPTHQLLPEEGKILDELQTDEAHWYLHTAFWGRGTVTFEEMIEYKRQKLADKTPGLVLRNIVSSTTTDDRTSLPVVDARG